MCSNPKELVNGSYSPIKKYYFNEEQIKYVCDKDFQINFKYEYNSHVQYIQNQTYFSNLSSLMSCKNGSFPSYLDIACQKSKKNLYKKLLWTL